MYRCNRYMLRRYVWVKAYHRKFVSNLVVVKHSTSKLYTDNMIFMCYRLISNANTHLLCTAKAVVV